MNPALLNNPFLQVAMPIMFTILIATWVNNKGSGGLNRRIDDLTQIALLEERVSPLGRRLPQSSVQRLSEPVSLPLTSSRTRSPRLNTRPSNVVSRDSLQPFSLSFS